MAMLNNQRVSDTLKIGYTDTPHMAIVMGIRMIEQRIYGTSTLFSATNWQ